MTIKMTLDIGRDDAAESRKGGGGSSVPMYKPLPDEAGSSFTNEIFMPLFKPANWKLFNLSTEEAARLGATTKNPLINVEGIPDLYTFFFKVPVHNVKNFIRSDGSTGFASVVCPIQLNNYLVENLGYRPLFTETKCAFCEAAALAWGEHNDRWSQVEREKDIVKKELNREGYLNVRKSDAILSQTHEKATSLKIHDRHITLVFDQGKLVGSRPTEEGEVLSYRVWPNTPKTVVDSLKVLYNQAESYGTNPFFDFGNPNGFQILSLVKDTTACTKQSLRDTKYNLIPGPVVPQADEWKAYLTNIDGMPDPTDLLTLLPYNEMAIYAFPQTETLNKPVTAPVEPQTPAPTAAPSPTMAPPTAAPSPTMAPPTAAPAPTMAPPTATPAPAPAAIPPGPPGSVPVSAPPTATPAPMPTSAPAPAAPVTVAPSFGDHAATDDDDGIDW